jgi:RNA polymerase sigma-70 factor (ECF subfamily)
MINEQTFERFKAGDNKAFNVIYNEFAPKLNRFLLNRYKCDIIMEDIVQETFIRLLDKRTMIRCYTSLFSYLRETAKNIYIDLYRSNMRKKTVSLEEVVQTGIEPQSGSLENELMMQNLLQHVDSIVEKLPDRQREIFNLRQQGFSYEEIATKLGISPRTVNTHIYQYSITLQKHWAD